MRIRSRVFVLLAPVVAVAPMLALSPAPTGLGRARSCEEAQLIAGELRCDEELVDARGVCPGVAGDVVALDHHGCHVERMPPEQLAALAQLVDINTASITELASLPGIGPVLAERIVAGRPFANVDALLEVRGIGPRKLEQLRGRARVRAQPR